MTSQTKTARFFGTELGKAQIQFHRKKDKSGMLRVGYLPVENTKEFQIFELIDCAYQEKRGKIELVSGELEQLVQFFIEKDILSLALPTPEYNESDERILLVLRNAEGLYYPIGIPGSALVLPEYKILKEVIDRVAHVFESVPLNHVELNSRYLPAGFEMPPQMMFSTLRLQGDWKIYIFEDPGVEQGLWLEIVPMSEQRFDNAGNDRIEASDPIVVMRIFVGMDDFVDYHSFYETQPKVEPLTFSYEESSIQTAWLNWDFNHGLESHIKVPFPEFPSKIIIDIKVEREQKYLALKAKEVANAWLQAYVRPEYYGKL